ncbi:uncharacterized protein LOC141816856, partial [Curcuma longa]
DLCKKNTENRKKQLYTHTGGSKTIARRKHEEERQRGSSISRGELWVMLHKKKDGSYIHDNAEVIGEKIINIEREDDSSKGFSKIDSLSQAIGKEHPGRVRGVGSGPCPTQGVHLHSHKVQDHLPRLVMMLNNLLIIPTVVQIKLVVRLHLSLGITTLQV